jgi:hypothetical protein
MRVEAVRAAGGYDDSLIAGEEPDLCLRMRRLGWGVLRIDAEMTVHDAALTRFGQWWKRSVRAGHAYAEGAARHGRGPERHWVRETRSNWLWGVGVPVAALGTAPATAGLSLAAFGAYGALGTRVYLSARRRGMSAENARLFSTFCVISKLPQAFGQGLYWLKRATGRRGGLIEYKGPRVDPKADPSRDPGHP